MITENDLILYRGETPSAVGFDVHGGYGETWTTDAAYAAGYADPPHGYVKKAILPHTAKRLVLITADDEGYSDYDWNGIETLQAIVDVPYLKAMLQSNYKQLWVSARKCTRQEKGTEAVGNLNKKGTTPYS